MKRIFIIVSILCCTLTVTAQVDNAKDAKKLADEQCKEFGANSATIGTNNNHAGSITITGRSNTGTSTQGVQHSVNGGGNIGGSATIGVLSGKAGVEGSYTRQGQRTDTNSGKESQSTSTFYYNCK